MVSEHQKPSLTSSRKMPYLIQLQGTGVGGRHDVLKLRVGGFESVTSKQLGIFTTDSTSLRLKALTMELDHFVHLNDH